MSKHRNQNESKSGSVNTHEGAVLTGNTAIVSAERGVTALGFWLYLMTDCVLFAGLFATFAVLRGSTFGGPSASDIISLPYVLTETMLLLTSSFICGLAVLAARRNRRDQVLWLLGITFALGVGFLGMELHEFNNLVREGSDWQSSGFLSAFFTLVGTHGAHITAGLLWLLALVPRLYSQGITRISAQRLVLFSVFWHFLDVVWIFIFTFVYMIGATQ